MLRPPKTMNPPPLKAPLAIHTLARTHVRICTQQANKLQPGAPDEILEMSKQMLVRKQEEMKLR